MSRLNEIRAALANDYDSCPELAKEDVALLLAVVGLELAGGPPELFVRVNRKIANDNVNYDLKVRARATKRADAWEKLT